MEANGNMNNGQNGQNGQSDGNWISLMDEEAKKKSNYFHMEPTDQKIITVMSNPVKGVSSYDQKQQQNQNQQGPAKAPRTVFTMSVMVDGETDPIPWEFSNRSVMSQFVAAAKQYNLKSLIGCRFMVKTVGQTIQKKEWFILLLSAPGLNLNIAPPVASQPVNQAAPQAKPPVDPQGIDWINSQKQGMQQPA